MDEIKISAAAPVEPSGAPAMERTSAFHATNLEAKTAQHGGTLKKLSLLVATVFVFLLPIAFWGSTSAYSIKFGLLLIADALLLCAFLASLFTESRITLPKTRFILPLLLIPLGLTVSSLFSGSFANSFFGNTAEVGTTASFIALAVLLLGSLYAFSKFKPYGALAKAYLISAAVLVVHFLLISMMYRGTISPWNGFPILLAGSYVDLAVMMAGAVLISVYALKEKRGLPATIAIWALSVFAFLIIGAVGSRAVEILLALALLADYLVHKRVTKFSAGAFVISLVFAIAGSNISAPLSSFFRVNSLDIKPSLSATTNIIMKQWATNPVTGAGPNRFVELWAMYKPASINMSDFWAQDFFFGSSVVTTMAATGGLIFVLLILAFAVFYLLNGLKLLRMPQSNEKNIALGTFLLASMLWAIVFLYNPGITVLAMAFIATALFAQSLVAAGVAKYSDLALNGGVRTTALIAVTLIFIAGVGYTELLSWKKLQAANAFSEALTAYQQDGDLAKATVSIDQANTIAKSDLYYRTISNALTIDLANKIANFKTDAPQAERDALQNEVSAAIAYAGEATKYNPTNYLNHLAEAKVYDQLAYQNVEGALDKALASYAEVEKRNPMNPSVQLAFARLSALKGEVEKSREYANKSVSLKPNYAAAYYFLAQLEAAVNNVPQAISNVEKAALSDPNNAGLHFQLGLIKYNVRDFKGAAVAFENSIKLIPEYANAKYFLGLSRFYTGDKEGAIKQFEEVEKSNPDNAEVKLILTNLKEGRDPFANAKPPVDNKPGKRQTPPVEQ